MRKERLRKSRLFDLGSVNQRERCKSSILATLQPRHCAYQIGKGWTGVSIPDDSSERYIFRPSLISIDCRRHCLRSVKYHFLAVHLLVVLGTLSFVHGNVVRLDARPGPRKTKNLASPSLNVTIIDPELLSNPTCNGLSRNRLPWIRGAS